MDDSGWQLMRDRQAMQIRSWDLSQEAAAARLGIGRVRLSYILRGRLSVFSHDQLISLIAAAASAPEDRIEEAE